MQKHPFGRTGLSVSPLGFGGAPIGFLETERQKTARIVDHLLEGGVNVIDTAAAYAGSEQMLGEVLNGRRDQVVLVSKCGQAFDDLPGEAWSPEVIAATVDRALNRLKTDHLDVMLLHSCDLDTLKKGDAISALVEAREAGKVRHVGYSGDNDAAAWAAAQPDIAVIETSINIADQQNIEQVLPVCREHEVGVLAKRPIANAAWKKIGEQPGFYQNYAEAYTRRFAAMDLDATTLGFGGAKDWPEIALRFTLSQPGVHTAIIGTTNPDNAAANIAAANKGALESRAVTELRNAFRKAAAVADESWHGLT